MAKKKTTAKKPKAGTSKESSQARKAMFIEIYLANGNNARQAAVDAGYSAKSAAQQASRLLKDVNISARIQERVKILANKYELTTETVIRSIMQEMHFDPAKLYDENGYFKKVCDLDEDTRMALQAIEADQVGSVEAPVYTTKIKWAMKYQAREQAMRFLGMFKEDNNQKGLLGDLPRATVKAIMERLRGVTD